MKRDKPVGREAVFNRYYHMIRSRNYYLLRNDPKSMTMVKYVEGKMSTLAGVIRDMDWLQDYRNWMVFKGYTHELQEKGNELTEKFGTKAEPKEPSKFNDTDQFRKLTLAYYHEAIQNQGMTHDEFMQRFKNEFADILESWESGTK